MRTRMYRSITLFLLLLVSACNDEETLMIAGGGIGGTGTPEQSTPAGGTVPNVGTISMKTSMIPLNVGPLTQVHPLIVNGVTYDTQNALILINDEQAFLEDLKIGMMVKVEGEKDDALKTGTAQLVAFNETLRGPIQTIEQDSLTVLNQTVKVDTWTVLEEMRGLYELKVGQWVGISGFSSLGQTIQATRLVPVPEAPLSRIRGQISQIDSVLQTFMLGKLKVDYRNLQLLTGDITENQFAEVQGQWLDNQFVADYLTIESGPLGFLGEGRSLELYGTVKDVKGPDTFSLSDFSVLTTPETLFVDGTLEDIQEGERLTVRGHLDSEDRLVGEEVKFLRE